MAGKLAVVKFDSVILEPGDRWTVRLQLGFTENWIVTAAVERHHQAAVRCDFHGAARLDELAVKRLRFRLFEATQLTAQPAITPIG